MIDFLYSVDVAIFFFINHSLSNPVFDVVMPFLTDLNKQRPAQIIALFAWLVLMIKGGKNGRTVGILLIATIIVSDQFSSSVLKHLFGRLRPCHVLNSVRMLVDCGSGLSFPSSHAVNNFAAATIISFYYRKQKWWWFSFAALIAFTRPYVGVHYPSDIVGGAIIGSGCALALIYAWKFLENKITFHSTG